MGLEKFCGCFTAIVTPFKNNKVDFGALIDLVSWQIESGIHGLVPCGSTGEAATMTQSERLEVVSAVVKTANGKVPVIAGASSNHTAEAIESAKAFEDLGVDAVMLCAPYYNKPTQSGMIRHFESVASFLSGPMVLYNVPGRTASSIETQTVLELSKISNIIGIKEASGKVENIVGILAGKSDFIVFSGEDSLYYPLLAVGAKGLISVTANVAPAKMAAVYDAWKSGNINLAKDRYYELWPLFGAMFMESNPIPVKAALAMMDRISPELRLPMTQITEANRPRLEAMLKNAGVL